MAEPVAALHPVIAARTRLGDHQALRDAALAAELADRVAHDARTARLGLESGCHGGVAHVQGAVGGEPERALVRRVLRGQAGLHAVWDLLSLDGEELDLLDVGCGSTKQVSTALGLDAVPGPGVDLVADLEEPLPLPADAFDHVFAVHVLEHVRDLLGLLAELHRVLRPTGLLHVLAPDRRHANAVADPTHVRFMDVQTFKYLCTPRPGVALWRPLMASSDGTTVHADLQPVKAGAAPATAHQLARWFG